MSFLIFTYSKKTKKKKKQQLVREFHTEGERDSGKKKKKNPFHAYPHPMHMDHHVVLLLLGS